MRASGADRLADGESLVAAEIIHDHDVAGCQRRHQHLLDPGQEALAIDRPVEHQRRIDAVMTQGREEGQRLPVAVRDFREQLLAAGRPAAQACHVGLRPCFVDKHQPCGIDVALVRFPAQTQARYVRTVLLGCEQRLFF